MIDFDEINPGADKWSVLSATAPYAVTLLVRQGRQIDLGHARAAEMTRIAFEGQSYRLRVGLFRRAEEIVALDSFRSGDDRPPQDDMRASVFLRFEGKLS